MKMSKNLEYPVFFQNIPETAANITDRETDLKIQKILFFYLTAFLSTTVLFKLKWGIYVDIPN